MRVGRVELRDADGCGLAYVWVSVFETMPELFCEGVDDDGYGYVGHRADGEGPDERVAVIAVLYDGALDKVNRITRVRHKLEGNLG